MTAIPEERVEGLVARQVVLADDLARPFSASHGATVACVPPRVPRSFILPSCHKERVRGRHLEALRVGADRLLSHTATRQTSPVPALSGAGRRARRDALLGRSRALGFPRWWRRCW